MAVTDENIVGLFAALLAERRVLLIASKLSTVRRGQPGRGGAKAWLRPSGGGPAGRIPGSNSTGRDLRQSPGSAPLNIRVELDPGSALLGGESEWAAL